MLVIGAMGFAKEVFEILRVNNQTANLFFFDDVNEEVKGRIFDKYGVIKSISEAQALFRNVNSDFTIGIGNPRLRKLMYDKFQKIDGKFTSVISKHAQIGSYDVIINRGCNILPLAIVSNGSSLGIGCILYYNVTITHDCRVGDFVELSPGATLLGRVEIGAYSQIGANATILPNLKIGSNVIVGAGAVVTKNIPNNSVAVGIPAKIINTIE